MVNKNSADTFLLTGKQIHKNNMNVLARCREDYITTALYKLLRSQ